MLTRSKRNHTEVSYPSSKKKRISGKHEELISDSFRGPEKSEAVDPSASTNVSPQVAPINMTRALSKWHVPEIKGGEVYYIPEVVIFILLPSMGMKIFNDTV